MPQIIVGNVKIHIEIPLLLIFFAFTFTDPIRTNLIIYRMCYITLGKNQTECALLGSNNPDNETAILEKIVEPYAAVLNMVHSFTDATISAMICLFVGPWSDRFGRKPFLIYPIIGFTIYFVLFSIFAFLDRISPWYSLICSVPVYLTGGVSSYLTVLLCYITDVTEESNRGVRMAIFEAILASGIFFGNISSAAVFAATNYWTIFIIAASCCLTNVLYTIYFVPESLQNPENDGRFRGLFSLSNVKEMIVVTFKPRIHYDRFIVLSSLVILTIFILAINGDGSVVFLFLREKFHWSLEQYTLYSAAHNVSWIIGTIIGTYILHKFFRIEEHFMIVIGLISMFLGMLGMGLATTNWLVYAAAFTRSLGGIVSPMVRSMVSKIIPNEEVGKIFALIVISESLFGIGGSPIFTFIYNATLATDPAIFNFVEVGFHGFDIILALAIVYARKIGSSHGDYSPIEGDNCDGNGSDFD